jgi:hypothetical protein
LDTRALSTSLLATSCLLAACGSEQPDYVHSSSALFDEDWRSAYTRVVTCKPSPTHNADHVETWVSAGAADAYRDRTLEFPTGAVVLKAQYGGPGCDDQEVAFTVMKKLVDGPVTQLDDWDWQRVEADGSLGFDPESSGFCGDCHMGCDQGSFMCDLPE